MGIPRKVEIAMFIEVLEGMLGHVEMEVAVTEILIEDNVYATRHSITKRIQQ